MIVKIGRRRIEIGNDYLYLGPNRLLARDINLQRHGMRELLMPGDLY